MSEQRDYSGERRTFTRNSRANVNGFTPRIEPEERKQKEKMFYLGSGIRIPGFKGLLVGFFDFDWLFLLVTLVLVGVGFCTMYSASYVSGYYNNNLNTFYYASKQLVFNGLGILAMLVASVVNYKWLEKKLFSNGIYVFTFIVLIICAVFSLGRLDMSFCPRVNGANRWIYLGPLNFQPSELAKFVCILFVAKCLDGFRNNPKSDECYVAALKSFIPLVLLVVVEPHVSATVIILGTVGILMVVGGIPLSRLFLFPVFIPLSSWRIAAKGRKGKKYNTAFRRVLVILGVVAVIILLVMFWGKISSKFGHVGGRISTWLDPLDTSTADAMDSTHQIRQSLYGIANGQIFGVGPGNSKIKHLFLPEPHNDFIFAVYCEEMGLVGAFALIVLFIVFVYKGIAISLKADTRFGTYLGLGISLQIGLQALFNIGVATGTIPNTGISLPFFSYGGTSMIVLLAEVGVLLSISRTNHDVLRTDW